MLGDGPISLGFDCFGDVHAVVRPCIFVADTDANFLGRMVCRPGQLAIVQEGSAFQILHPIFLDLVDVQLGQLCADVHRHPRLHRHPRFDTLLGGAPTQQQPI